MCVCVCVSAPVGSGEEGSVPRRQADEEVCRHPPPHQAGPRCEDQRGGEPDAALIVTRFLLWFFILTPPSSPGPGQPLAATLASETRLKSPRSCVSSLRFMTLTLAFSSKEAEEVLFFFFMSSQPANEQTRQRFSSQLMLMLAVARTRSGETV